MENRRKAFADTDFAGPSAFGNEGGPATSPGDRGGAVCHCEED